VVYIARHAEDIIFNAVWKQLFLLLSFFHVVVIVHVLAVTSDRLQQVMSRDLANLSIGLVL